MGGGRRGSTGRTASPSSQARCTALTKAGPPVASIATRVGTGGSLPAAMAGMNRWVAGARVRTLPAAVVPVVVGTAVASAQGTVIWWRAAAALVVALAIQVGTNYANDYHDGIRGTVRPTTARIVPGCIVCSRNGALCEGPFLAPSGPTTGAS